MISGARQRNGRSLLLALMVSGLLAGLVGMHHLVLGGPSGSMDVATPAPAEAHGPAPVPSPDPHGADHGSSLLHLCLAVLTAVALLVVPLLVWWGRAEFGPTTRSRPVRASSMPRAPPVTVPVRLALLCVLRT